MSEQIPDGCHACGALPCDWVESPKWRPFNTAPKDRSYILALLGDLKDERNQHWSGRAFVVRHEGMTSRSGYDLGWSLFPGYGGVPDEWFVGWMPLPATPGEAV